MIPSRSAGQSSISKQSNPFPDLWERLLPGFCPERVDDPPTVGYLHQGTMDSDAP